MNVLCWHSSIQSFKILSINLSVKPFAISMPFSDSAEGHTTEDTAQALIQPLDPSPVTQCQSGILSTMASRISNKIQDWFTKIK